MVLPSISRFFERRWYNLHDLYDKNYLSINNTFISSPLSFPGVVYGDGDLSGELDIRRYAAGFSHQIKHMGKLHTISPPMLEGKTYLQ